MRVLISRALCVSIVLCLASAAGLMAANEAQLPNLKSGLVEKAQGGQIDWGREMFYAVGEGAVPTPSEVPNRAKAVLKAKDYAKMDAIANMRMLIAGTSISYSATGKDYMVNDATLTQKIEGYVKNVVVLKTETIKQGKDMTVKVTVGCPMYGYQGPGAALLQAASEIARETGVEIHEATEKSTQTNQIPPVMQNPDLAPVKIEIKGKTTVVEPEPIRLAVVEEKPVEEKPAEKTAEPAETTIVVAENKSVEKTAEPVVEAKIEPAKSDNTPPAIEKISQPAQPTAVYTSLVIDTLGLNVMRAMSPKIRTQGGAEVYGTLQISPDDVQDAGPVAYVRTLADAKTCPRAGAKPLIVKAIGRAGGRRMCDAVLSDEDVEKVKAADGSSKPPFLAAMKVILVVDPLKL